MITLSAFADEAASSLAGQIEALHRNRISYIELRGIDGRNIKTISLKEAEGYSRQLEEAGIKVWAIGSPIGKSEIAGDFETVLQEARHVFALANIFHTKRVRIFSFFHAYDAREEVLRRLNLLVAEADKFHVTCCHENEKGIYGDTAARVVDILGHVEGLECVYDPANFIQVGERADDTLPLLHARSDYFHIKDVVSATGALVPAGYGDGQIERLVSMIDGDKTLTLEPHLAIFDGYAAIDDTAMKNKFTFRTNGEAFDAAVGALKEVLVRAGYRETEKGFVR